jgi:hypothetical protein
MNENREDGKKCILITKIRQSCDSSICFFLFRSSCCFQGCSLTSSIDILSLYCFSFAHHYCYSCSLLSSSFPFLFSLSIQIIKTLMSILLLLALLVLLFSLSLSSLLFFFSFSFADEVIVVSKGVFYNASLLFLTHQLLQCMQIENFVCTRP